MADCVRTVKPSALGLEISTSDVTIFDGDLDCISLPVNPDLNDVLNALAVAICNATPPRPVTIDADNVTYSGDTTFSCFTIGVPTPSVQDVIEILATEICDLSQDMNLLTAADIAVGSIDLGCLAAEGPFNNLEQLFTGVIENICDLITATGGFTDGSGSTGSLTSGNAVVGDIKPVLDSTVIYDGATPRSWAFSGNNTTYNGSSLSVTIDDGSGGGSKYVVKGWLVQINQANVNLVASRDNYVDITDSGTFTVSDVAYDAAAPAIASNSMRLFRFRTSGTGVSSFTDLTNYYAFDGSTFADNSIATRHITDLSVTGAKLEDYGTSGSVGDADFIQVTWDAKGRVTSASTSSKINIGFDSVLTDEDILIWDATNNIWKNAPIIGTLLPSGSNNQTLRYDSGSSNYISSSFLLNTGSEVGIGIQNGLPLETLTIGSSGSFGMQLSQVSGLAAAATGGGSLTSGTYYYVIAARDGVGSTVLSNEVSASVDGAVTTAISISWAEQPFAASYRIFRGTTQGVYTQFMDKSGLPEITDTGAGWSAGSPGSITNINAYSLYIDPTEFSIGDSSLATTEKMVSFSNRSSTKSTLFSLSQLGDIDAGTPADVIAALVDVDTLSRNTTNTNYGINIADVNGSDVANVGVRVNVTDSGPGDNYGIRINVSNAGAGNAYGVQVQDGTEGDRKVLLSDASGRGSWSEPVTSFTEAMASIAFATTGSWDTVSLVGPTVNETAFVLIVRDGSGGISTLGVRTLGSAVVRQFTLDGAASITVPVRVGASGQIELFQSDTACAFSYIGKM